MFNKGTHVTANKNDYFTAVFFQQLMSSSITWNTLKKKNIYRTLNLGSRYISAMFRQAGSSLERNDKEFVGRETAKKKKKRFRNLSLEYRNISFSPQCFKSLCI